MVIHNFKVGQVYRLTLEDRLIKVEKVSAATVHFSGLDGCGYSKDVDGFYPFNIFDAYLSELYQLVEDSEATHDVYFFDEQGIYVTVSRSHVMGKPWSYAINGVTRCALDKLSETRDEAMKRGLEEAEGIYQEKLILKTNKVC